jgi:hypothetical protein
MFVIVFAKKAKTPPNNINFPYSNTELKHGAIYIGIKTMDFKLLDKNKKQFVASASCSRPQWNTPHFSRGSKLFVCPEQESNLHGLKRPQGPQPCVSTNSTTRAKKIRNSKIIIFFQIPDSGDPAGARTQDPRLKRALLYQLSY